jgi:hypothetical protein
MKWLTSYVTPDIQFVNEHIEGLIACIDPEKRERCTRGLDKLANTSDGNIDPNVKALAGCISDMIRNDGDKPHQGKICTYEELAIWHVIAGSPFTEIISVLSQGALAYLRWFDTFQYQEKEIEYRTWKATFDPNKFDDIVRYFVDESDRRYYCLIRRMTNYPSSVYWEKAAFAAFGGGYKESIRRVMAEVELEPQSEIASPHYISQLIYQQNISAVKRR